MKRNSKIHMFIFVVCAFLSLWAANAKAESSIENVSILNTGQVEVWGIIENYREGDEVTILMISGEGTGSIDDGSIVYIDQRKIGNNGVFYFEFSIDERFSQENYILRIGSSTEGFTVLEASGTLPQIPPVVYQITNNSVVIGMDAYDLDSPYYESGNIIESLADGGNKIYYKINDMWFDVLDEECTSWQYLSEKNAISEDEWGAWYIRQYYNTVLNLST